MEDKLSFVQPDLQAIYIRNQKEVFCSDNNQQAYNIGILIKGKAKIVSPDKIRYINSGDIFAVGRYDKVSVEYGDKSEFYDLRFSSKIYRDIDKNIDILNFFNRSEYSVFSEFLLNDSFSHAVKNLHRALENLGSRHFIFAAILDIILEMKYLIEKEEKPTIKETDSNFTKIVFYTNNHLSEKITLKGLAEKLFISERCITNNVRRIKNCSYHELLTGIRVETAKKMIVEHPLLSLASVAELCGFESYSSFYRNYYKITGETPSMARKRITE